MSALPEAAAWQPLLDRNGKLFGDLRTGSRIGLARRSDLQRRGAPMIVWEARKGRLHALDQPFAGFDDPSLDVMLVGDDEAVNEVASNLDGDDALPVLKAQVRQGGFVCYLMRVQCDLIEAGYEDVLQSMGVVFMGACR
ncbi:MAG: hypothetical protein EPO23_01065 [Xanthobacteraceae bacterium]|nr:MAG: hypothetical protein EPO23_01065 [Xanthobacteraceae bacterium]